MKSPPFGGLSLHGGYYFYVCGSQLSVLKLGSLLSYSHEYSLDHFVCIAELANGGFCWWVHYGLDSTESD